MKKTKKVIVLSEQKRNLAGKLSLYMQKFNCEFYEYDKDYNELLQILKNSAPDMIISDISLKNGDGIALLKYCQSESDLQNVKFVFLTYIFSQPIIDLAYDEGADYYFLLNQDLSYIGEILERILELDWKNNYVNGCNKNLIDNNGKLLDCSLEKDITELLLDLRMPPNIKGYKYIRDVIILYVKEKRSSIYITKQLYPQIAEKYETSVSNVERCIRHALIKLWQNNIQDKKEILMKFSIYIERGRPTNSEFISLISEKIRTDYRKNGCFSYNDKL